MFYLILYVLTIFFINLGFIHVPLVDLGFGVFSPMAVVVGAVFVIRDFAQRAVGHWVWLGMVSGCFISFYFADPTIAIASVFSFAISEVADWCVYYYTKRQFHQRVLYSSLVSAPVDTFVFLSLINHYSIPTLVIMVGCKLLVAIGVWYHGKNRQSSSEANGL